MPIYWTDALNKAKVVANRCEFCKKLFTDGLINIDGLKFCGNNCKTKWFRELDRREKGY